MATPAGLRQRPVLL